MTFDKAAQYLLGLGHETLAIKLGLANVERLLAALSHPERDFPAVQIAGTNGKGSTAAMLDAMLRAASVRTGLYTSPHLVSITERIKIGGREISRADFARHTERVRAAALTMRDATGALPSFFEQVTAIALLALSDARVELAILETGLGGRLDATTAARAATVGITPIALDHQEYLGTTLTEIAAEKAAIIRAGTDAVVAPQSPDALAVILARCREVGVTPRFSTSDITVMGVTDDGRLRATFRTIEDLYENVLLSLRGRHQLTNAATAIALAELLRARGFPQLTRERIVAGLESAEHAGRLELITGEPALLLDGAHNPAGARALSDYLDEFVRAPVTLVFGAMRDKDLTEIAAALFPAADRLILTAIDNPRAAAPDALRNFVPASFDPAKVFLASSSIEALRLARELTPHDGMVCITGSLYLVGEIKSLLAGGGA
ncbi:MAG: dihydrofolate synthase / folylpolyglutamate synthase [Acidobacteriota bacterium]|jgi:dihydrofolate synthase/folylpolyglutamate synthase|nr:dihydrofolate synthase / folylpolyglutamate synthase [Acidobacteriota bacterium]